MLYNVDFIKYINYFYIRKGSESIIRINNIVKKLYQFWNYL